MYSLGPEAEVLHQRYAYALISLAKEENLLKKVADCLNFFVQLLKTNKEAELFFIHPEIGKESKHLLLSKIAEKINMPSSFFDFLKLLIDKHRIRLIHGIFLKYRDVYDDLMRRQKVFIRASASLTHTARTRLQNCLEKGIGKKILFEEIIDPSLIGGIRVQINDDVYDFSIKANLDEFQNKLLA
ncbi:MAG: ATP synthase F1 subunit delta [Candidatus Omnitrophota bacterium]